MTTAPIHSLIDAINRHDDDAIAQLLTGPIDLGGHGTEGEAVLTQAADRARDDLLPVFAKKGADPNHASARGNTALHAAARGGLVDVVKAALALKGDPNRTNHDGETPLDLIPSFYGKGGWDGKTPDFMDAEAEYARLVRRAGDERESDRLAVAKHLIRGGADPAQARFALARAIENGYRELARFFVDSGAPAGAEALRAVLDQSGAASVRDDQVIIARILASGTSLKPKLRAEAEKWMSNVAATPEDKLLRAARAEDRKEFWELADEHSFPAQPVPADLDTAALKYAHDGGADAVRSRAVIEKGVLRLAAVLGADRERVQTELGKVPHGGGDAWTFLGRAFEQVGPFLWTKRAEQLKSRWLRSYVVPLTHELRKELARAQKQLRKSRQYYNEKGKAAIDTGELVLAEDADLWLLAPREGGGRQLVHTHPEGTWVLSEHPVALLEEAIASVSPKTKAKAKATATTKAKAKAPAKTKASAAGKKPKR